MAEKFMVAVVGIKFDDEQIDEKMVLLEMKYRTEIPLGIVNMEANSLLVAETDLGVYAMGLVTGVGFRELKEREIT